MDRGPFSDGSVLRAADSDGGVSVRHANDESAHAGSNATTNDENHAALLLCDHGLFPGGACPLLGREQSLFLCSAVLRYEEIRYPGGVVGLRRVV